jgi:hypothetical protein
MDKQCEKKTGPKWIGMKYNVDFKEIIRNEVQYSRTFFDWIGTYPYNLSGGSHGNL